LRTASCARCPSPGGGAALLGALDHEVEQLVGLRGIAGEPVVERIADRLLDDARRLGGGEPVLGLALEFRLADEHREHAGAPPSRRRW
jgi:hypothetical protein